MPTFLKSINPQRMTLEQKRIVKLVNVGVYISDFLLNASFIFDNEQRKEDEILKEIFVTLDKILKEKTNELIKKHFNENEFKQTILIFKEDETNIDTVNKD